MHGPPSIKNENYRQLLEQLAALRLPPLKGRRFLNISCGDGFFCGYAAFSGAAQIIGLDSSESALDLAKANFPGCDFRHGLSESLPDQDFDVILFASASYHPRGVGMLIHQLMGKLASGGTLVIEIGIVDSKENFERVRDGKTEFILPSWNMIKNILDRYAWKSIGHRTFLPEKQIAQHVFHVCNMKPYAFLLLEPPASGKSTIQRVAFKKPGVLLVSGDQVLLNIFNGITSTSPQLEALVRDHFISTSIAKLTKIIFATGLGPDLIRTWCEQAGQRHFVLDSYLHKKFHQQLQNQLKNLGYIPVNINWSLDSGIPLPKHATAATENYRAHLLETLSIDDPEKLPVLKHQSLNASDNDNRVRLFSKIKKVIANINK